MNRMTNDQLTVGQTAERLGVTVRTLHHWDAEGLAQPSARSAAGYRLYTPADLDRLERVVLYRELGLGLNAICGLLDDPDMDAVATLHEQSARTEEHIHRLQQLQGSLRNMIEAHERGPLVGPERQEEVLGEGWNPDWPAQARLAGATRRSGGSTPNGRPYGRRRGGRNSPEKRRSSTATSSGPCRTAQSPETPGQTISWNGTATCSAGTFPSHDRCRSAWGGYTSQTRRSPRTTTRCTPGSRCGFERPSTRAHGSTGLTPTLPAGSEPALTLVGGRPRGSEPRA
ncbi:DNA-binding transcriptional MerR regulator [Kocuria rhizophila]